MIQSIIEPFADRCFSPDETPIVRQTAKAKALKII
jgi:hypothetical protein